MSSRKTSPDSGRTAQDQGAKTAPASAKTKATRGATSGAKPSSTSSGPSSNNKIVVPRKTQTFEQRVSVPKMRRGLGRQKSLRIESKEPKKPRPPLRLPQVSLRFGPLTPARVASLLLALTAAALLLFLFAADGFYVYTAEITGNRLVAAHDIYARSGIDSKNIFAIRPGEAARLIEGLPFVKAAQVNLGFPARVTIEVEERRPALAWQVAGTTYSVADDGTVLPATSAGSGSPPRADGLPLVEAEGGPLQFGAKVNGQAVALALRLRGLVPSAQKLVYSVERGMGVVTAQGWPVFFGVQDDEIAARVAVLNSLTDQLRERRIEPEFIDLRSSSRPFYRVKGGAVDAGPRPTPRP